MNGNQISDPWGLVSNLTESLALPALRVFREGAGEVTRDAEWAAYSLAIDLGRCRMFHVDPGEIDGELPLSVAFAAARFAQGEVEGLVSEFPTLAERLAQEATDFDRETIGVELLSGVIQSRAAYLAISETFEAEIDCGNGEHLDEVLDALARLNGGQDAIDEAMNEHIIDLCFLARSNAVKNWRVMFGDAENTPWWFESLDKAHENRNVEPLLFRAPVAPAWEPARDLRSVRQALVMGADSALGETPDADQGRTSGLVRKWLSPGGKYYASLLIPVEADVKDGFTLQLLFWHVEGEQKDLPADPLCGESVTLGPVSGIIEEHVIDQDGEKGVGLLFDSRTLESDPPSTEGIHLTVGGNGWIYEPQTDQEE